MLPSATSTRLLIIPHKCVLFLHLRISLDGPHFNQERYISSRNASYLQCVIPLIRNGNCNNIRRNEHKLSTFIILPYVFTSFFPPPTPFHDTSRLVTDEKFESLKTIDIVNEIWGYPRYSWINDRLAEKFHLLSWISRGVPISRIITKSEVKKISFGCSIRATDRLLWPANFRPGFTRGGFYQQHTKIFN